MEWQSWSPYGFFSLARFPILRIAIKVVLRLLTGHSAIERILWNKRKHRADTIIAIEEELRLSRNARLREIVNGEVVRDLDADVDYIHRDVDVDVDYIRRDVDADVDYIHRDVDADVDYIHSVKISDDGKRHRQILLRALEAIHGYRRLMIQVEQRRSTPFDGGNEEHERQLRVLWSLLFDIPLSSRISKEWQNIGFQGNDPATDFRGMGMLALDQLIFFCRSDQSGARRLLLLSNQPLYGFPFALVSIAMTALCRQLLNDGLLKNHLYNHNTVDSTSNIVSFHRAYCTIFVSFCQRWRRSEPESIMDFDRVRRTFEGELRRNLSNRAGQLDWSYLSSK